MVDMTASEDLWCWRRVYVLFQVYLRWLCVYYSLMPVFGWRARRGGRRAGLAFAGASGLCWVLCLFWLGFFEVPAKT